MIGEICRSPNLKRLKEVKDEMGDKCSVYVEIGVLYGGSLIMMMDLPHKTSFYGIDPFTGYYGESYDPHRNIDLTNHLEIVENNLKGNNPHNHEYKLIKGKSKAVVELVPDKIDFLFIDGDHSYEGVYEDFMSYKNKMNKNGLIVFDNYNDNAWVEVKKAVDEIVELHKENFKVKEKFGHCLILEKI